MYVVLLGYYNFLPFTEPNEPWPHKKVIPYCIKLEWILKKRKERRKKITYVTCKKTCTWLIGPWKIAADCNKWECDTDHHLKSVMLHCIVMMLKICDVTKWQEVSRTLYLSIIHILFIAPDNFALYYIT